MLILFGLAEANGRVVSRDRLIGTVSVDNLRRIDVAVCRLRKDGLSIESVSGVGYRLTGSFAFTRLP